MLVAGLVFVVSGTAGAVVFNQSYSGPLKFKFSNYDSMRIYFGPDGTYTDSSGPQGYTLGTLNSQAWAPGAAYGSIAAPGAKSGEDAWGLFELTTIAGRDPSTGQYNVILWEKGGAADTRPDIVGMFYGIDYQKVTLKTRADGLVEEEVWGGGNNMRCDFYEVPNGSAILADPTARTGTSTFPLWTVGTPVLQGAGLPGQFTTPPGDSDTQYWSKIIFNPADGSVVGRETAEGTAKLFLEWYGGTSYDQFHISGPDLEFTSQVYGNQTVFNWTGNTDDPAIGGTGEWDEDDNYNNVVPEPLTMLGMVFAIGGTCKYFRRRFGL